MKVAVVGGGAAGFFGALAVAEAAPHLEVVILEKSRQLLTKVRISGGGRCNVTHDCLDPAQLVRHYPRGSRELRGPFSRFGPRDTIQWFSQRGVPLKVEPDGRMFPTTDSSQTIVDCLQMEASRLGVEVRLGAGVRELTPQGNRWLLELDHGESLEVDAVLIASGSARPLYGLLERLGHRVEPLVPSLFSLNVPTSPLLDLSGVTVTQARLSLPEGALETEGALLLTHWGFSGPAALRLSAWGARWLHEQGYRARLLVNWVPSLSQGEIMALFQEERSLHPQKQLNTFTGLPLPRQLWRRLLELSQIAPEGRFAALSNRDCARLAQRLTADEYGIEGKTTYKQEFVTCGGVSLKEVNMKTLESRLHPGLYFAGEVLDVDGVTGGFNFQNAWTTSWLAGRAIAERGR